MVNEILKTDIPDDWNIKKLEPDVGFVRSGKRLPKGYYVTSMPTQHPYIRVQSKVLAQTIFLDVLILIIRQVTDILVAQDLRFFKETDYSFLCFNFGITNTHLTGTPLH